MLNKSQENETAANMCLQSGLYNAGASRAYYSAFQYAKAFLIRYNFDYETYLIGKSGNPQKDSFSHGTIVGALKKCIEDNFPDTKQRATIENKMILMNQLYKNRRIADYENTPISKMDLNISLNALKEIKNSINALLSNPTI